ncbi:transposase [Pochonia chlamydosporia 170]|uniref:Transposase n=1 Tax=Pochonia chlamydosporia 170 TaxID=1380566 RepID=A0A179F6Y0_METCM|nr:transposase [Pochonia chlamydosporia 170]OAQ61226.1 transposase [Pochonia chlamydosporia 170]
MSMSTSGLSPCANLRKQQSPSPGDQLHRQERERFSRQGRSSPSPVGDRPKSAGSSMTSIGRFYGLGDENALDNQFAAFPQTFSSLPQPHSSQGHHEPAWDLRSDYEIYLQNDFFHETRRVLRVRTLIPGPECDSFASEPESHPSAQQPQTRTRAEFESALSIVREVIGEGHKLTIDLARSYEREPIACTSLVTSTLSLNLYLLLYIIISTHSLTYG